MSSISNLGNKNMEKEISQLEVAVIVLAKAIEDGRIDGLVEEIKKIINYS